MSGPRAETETEVDADETDHEREAQRQLVDLTLPKSTTRHCVRQSIRQSLRPRRHTETLAGHRPNSVAFAGLNMPLSMNDVGLCVQCRILIKTDCAR